MLSLCLMRLILKLRQARMIQILVSLVLLYLDFDGQKKKETLGCDFTNHYKKSFMKTYEENLIRHKIIIRK
jgi:hypothetical protein